MIYEERLKAGSKTWKKWCPTGCGKSAYYYPGAKDDFPYTCDRCKKRFSKSMIKEQ